MQSATISQYVDSVSNPQAMFRTLRNVRPHRNQYGEVIFVSGNNSAVFKVDTDDGCIALKCYTRRVENLATRTKCIKTLEAEYLPEYRFLPEEIFILGPQAQWSQEPVTASQWIEGHTLIRELRRLCFADDKDGLAQLARQFDTMAMWLLSLDFAHGDLKHDNILVDTNGNLKLIDLDDAYVPQLMGYSSSSLGSPAYQHPKRDKHIFDRHIDDYSIALISLSLHALASDPKLLTKYNDSENIIMNAAEVWAGNSECFNTLQRDLAIRGKNKMLLMSDLLLSASPQIPELQGLLCRIEGGEASARLGDLKVDFEVVDDGDTECAVIRCGGLWGYANLVSGELLIDPIYSDALPFSQGLAAVRLRGNRIFIDKEGLCQIDCNKYKSIEPFREGLAKVSVCGGGGDSGWVGDMGGSEGRSRGWGSGWGRGGSEGMGSGCGSDSDGISGRGVGSDGGGELAATAHGQPTTSSKRTTINEQTTNGEQTKSSEQNKTIELFGFINHLGQVVVEPKYEMATSFRGGISFVKERGQWFAIDLAGQKLSDKGYVSITDIKKATLPMR